MEYHFTEKKVDEEWKEQVAREKQLARRGQGPEERPPADATPPPAGGSAGAPPPGGGVRPGTGAAAESGTPQGPAAEQRQPEQGPAAEADAALFESFLQSLAMQASMCLGAMPDPRTGLVAEDLGQARHLIDILGMIERKTRGNLAPREGQLLQLLLQDLRMAYVQRAQGAAGGMGQGPAGPGPQPGA